MKHNYAKLGKLADVNPPTVRNRIKHENFKKLFPQVTVENIFIAGTDKIQQTIIDVPDEILEEVIAFIKTRPAVSEWKFKGRKTGRPATKAKIVRREKAGRPRNPNILRDERGKPLKNK